MTSPARSPSFMPEYPMSLSLEPLSLSDALSTDSSNGGHALRQLEVASLEDCYPLNPGYSGYYPTKIAEPKPPNSLNQRVEEPGTIDEGDAKEEKRSESPPPDQVLDLESDASTSNRINNLRKAAPHLGPIQIKIMVDYVDPRSHGIEPSEGESEVTFHRETYGFPCTIQVIKNGPILLFLDRNISRGSYNVAEKVFDYTAGRLRAHLRPIKPSGYAMFAEAVKIHEKYPRVRGLVKTFRVTNLSKVTSAKGKSGDNSIGLLQAYYDGNANLLSGRRIPEDEDVLHHLFASVTFGLRTLHRDGYAHRDIKPENVLLRLNDVEIPVEADLCDFGFVTHKADTFKLHKELWTNYYLGPEYRSLFGSENFEPTLEFYHRLDAWALGCTLYFMYYGQDPNWLNYSDIEDLPAENLNDPTTPEGDSFRRWYDSLNTALPIEALLKRLLAIRPEDRCTMDEAYQIMEKARRADKTKDRTT